MPAYCGHDVHKPGLGRCVHGMISGLGGRAARGTASIHIAEGMLLPVPATDARLRLCALGGAHAARVRVYGLHQRLHVFGWGV
ncbi:hypothetical protein Tchar_01804 [Tepidimonas charontis]|uniref:Uncharacterized protein n=1 Tax=Tepidimonas charontis TaxID=2267262 RepID=A0A554XBQ0_9BURK|nr:hypothetical protein Tchar_01804 [Tepidimonas charontis]